MPTKLPGVLMKHYRNKRLKMINLHFRYYIPNDELLAFADKKAKGLLPKAGRPKRPVMETVAPLPADIFETVVPSSKGKQLNIQTVMKE